LIIEACETEPHCMNIHDQLVTECPHMPLTERR
jgi:hypothetical protein